LSATIVGFRSHAASLKNSHRFVLRDNQAILKTDVKAAVKAREAYKLLEQDMEKLRVTADLGAKLMVEPQDVQVALNAATRDLDELLDIADKALL
jgi:uncharacterized protein YqfA (UPF0365 family)